MVSKHSRSIDIVKYQGVDDILVMEIKTISRDELKAKLDNGDDFKLVMTMGDWHYNAKRIPGSLHTRDPREATELLDQNDEIVVYCSSEYCVASQVAYHILIKNGYTNVRRYAGGIIDWESAGFPLEGEMID